MAKGCAEARAVRWHRWRFRSGALFAGFCPVRGPTAAFRWEPGQTRGRESSVFPRLSCARARPETELEAFGLWKRQGGRCEIGIPRGQDSCRGHAGTCRPAGTKPVLCQTREESRWHLSTRSNSLACAEEGCWLQGRLPKRAFWQGFLREEPA